MSVFDHLLLFELIGEKEKFAELQLREVLVKSFSVDSYPYQNEWYPPQKNKKKNVPIVKCKHIDTLSVIRVLRVSHTSNLYT